MSIVLGLAANELGDFCPWLARHLVRWAAARWADHPDEAAGYAEEWSAIIEERPGKLFKLLTAAGFAVGATVTWQRRVLARRPFSLSGLALLVGVVVTAAVGALGTATWLVVAQRQEPQMTVAALVGLVTVASLATARIRIRSTWRSVSWTGSAILIGLGVAPVWWVVVSAAVGVAIANAVVRRPMVQAAFSCGKATLVAAAAGIAWTVLVPAGWTVPPWRTIGALALVQLIIAVTDSLLAVPAIAVATGTSVIQRFRVAGGQWIASLLQFPIAVLALVVVQLDQSLLLALPPAVFSLHQWHTARLRSRAERQIWQRLAAATDTFKTVDLTSVLHAAVRGAAQLFAAEHVEIETDVSGHRRLVRGDDHHILFDGAPHEAPTDDTNAACIPLEGNTGGPEIGLLRLRFGRPVRLSDRETTALQMFASALCTAVRNACAFADLAKQAAQHAHAAAHDPLTGLPNGRRLVDAGSALLNRQPDQTGVTLIRINLDNFKQINRTLGHHAGDQALAEIASRLRTADGPNTVIARLGGDNFAVLLTSPPALATHLAEAILAAVREPIEVDGVRITIEATAGIATAPATGDIVDILRGANVALHQAKRTGKRTATHIHAPNTVATERPPPPCGNLPLPIPNTIPPAAT